MTLLGWFLLGGWLSALALCVHLQRVLRATTARLNDTTVRLIVANADRDAAMEEVHRQVRLRTRGRRP